MCFHLPNKIGKKGYKHSQWWADGLYKVFVAIVSSWLRAYFPIGCFQISCFLFCFVLLIVLSILLSALIKSHCIPVLYLKKYTFGGVKGFYFFFLVKQKYSFLGKKYCFLREKKKKVVFLLCISYMYSGKKSSIYSTKVTLWCFKNIFFILNCRVTSFSHLKVGI